MILDIIRDTVKEADEIVADQSVSWELKYDLIFEYIIPKLKNLHVNFKWYDPDTTYEDDVRAYINALHEYIKND